MKMVNTSESKCVWFRIQNPKTRKNSIPCFIPENIDTGFEPETWNPAHRPPYHKSIIKLWILIILQFFDYYVLFKKNCNEPHGIPQLRPYWYRIIVYNPMLRFYSCILHKFVSQKKKTNWVRIIPTMSINFLPMGWIKN